MIFLFVFVGLVAVVFVFILFVVWGVKPADQSVKKEMDAFYKNGCPHCGSEDFFLYKYYYNHYSQNLYLPDEREATRLTCEGCKRELVYNGDSAASSNDRDPLVSKIKTQEAGNYYKVSVQKRHPGSGYSSCVYLLIFLMIPVILFFCVIIFSSLLDIQL